MTTGKGGESANRYGGYGQTGYEEKAADEPGVQADFDEQETKDEGAATASERVKKPQE